jgi:PAS domain S-box-containing protein
MSEATAKPPWTGWKGYLAALLAVGAALLVRLPLDAVLGSRRPYLTLFGGVAIAAWLSRWKAASVAALLGFVAAYALFVAPHYGSDPWPAPLVEFAGFAFSAGLIVAFGDAMHRARDRAERETRERRAGEFSERRRSELLRVTLASIGDAVVTTDAHGRVVGSNRVAQELTGWSEDQAVGQPLESVLRILDERTRQPVADLAERALSEGEVVHAVGQTLLVARSGEERAIEARAAPLRGPEGDVPGCVIAFRDVTERRSAERELWSGREELRITLSSIGDGVIVTDTGARVRSINAEAERLTGWSAQAAVGRAVEEVFRIVEEDTDEPVASPVARVLELGTVLGLANHTILIARDGRRTPIDDSAAPIREQNGPVQGVVLVFRDVAERRAAQRAQAQLASIVQYSADAIFTKDLDGIVQSWNAGAEQLFGYSGAEIIGKPITIIIPEDRRDEERMILARLRSGQPIERVETIRMAKNGRQIPVLISVSPLRDTDGRVIGAAKIIHDISDIVAAREALLASERRFRSMADIAPVLIWVSGADGGRTWFNRQWLEFVGRPIERELGQGWFENVHPDDAARCRETYARAFETRTPFSLAYRSKRRDGEYRWLLDNGIPRFGSRGEFSGYVGSCVDITEQKEAERALEEVDRRKDEFLAILSHELRNPLAPIRVAVSLLRRIAPPDPQLQELRETIDRQTLQLTRLLDDLLDVNRIASGKIVLRKVRASLGMAVSSALESVRPNLDERGHELVLAVPPEPIYVQGDPARLAQVFTNLLDNAAKYTEGRGRITLSVSSEGPQAVVRVADTGIGISAHQTTRIFEMFAQVAPPTEGGPGGLGVGLALARKLVELHGGTVEAHSAGLGRGSEFVVRLPRATEPREAARGPLDRAEVRPERRARRILVADDNVDSARMFTLALQALGYDVRTAHDGLASVQAAESFAPDVAFLDIGMPKLNGYDVARALRKRFGRDIALVAITGWGQDEDKRRAVEAGFDFHLTKPVDFEVVERLLQVQAHPGLPPPEL